MSEMFAVELSVYEKGRKRPEYTLDGDLNGVLTLKDLLEFTKSTLIVTADEVLKDEQAAGFDKKPVMTVDGKVGRSIQGVHPLGQVEFTARAEASNILFETYEALLYRSKVLTGKYKSSHFVFYNGTQVAASLRELEVWNAFASPKFKDGDVVRFVNIMPYARKLEREGVTAQRSKNRLELKRVRGKPKGDGSTIRAPNGTYFLTARSIKAKYKRNANIKFAFLPGSSMGLMDHFKTQRKGKPGKKYKPQKKRSYLYPSITITMTSGGVT